MAIPLLIKACNSKQKMKIIRIVGHNGQYFSNILMQNNFSKVILNFEILYHISLPFYINMYTQHTSTQLFKFCAKMEDDFCERDIDCNGSNHASAT